MFFRNWAQGDQLHSSWCGVSVFASVGSWILPVTVVLVITRVSYLYTTHLETDHDKKHLRPSAKSLAPSYIFITRVSTYTCVCIDTHMQTRCSHTYTHTQHTYLLSLLLDVLPTYLDLVTQTFQEVIVVLVVIH